MDLWAGGQYHILLTRLYLNLICENLSMRVQPAHSIHGQDFNMPSYINGFIVIMEWTNLYMQHRVSMS